MSEAVPAAPDSRRRVPRTRGATSGLLLMVLGAWGALVPFIGPLFDYGFTPNSHQAWHWTAARGWYEVLPGAVAFVGGLLLLVSTRRTMTMIGAWLGIAAGAWFIIGPAISGQLTLGAIGSATGDSAGLRAISVLGHFYLLGAVILFLASAAFGRLSVVSLRDVRVAEQRDAARIEAEEAAARDAAARDAAARDAAARDLVMREGEERRAREAETQESPPAAQPTAAPNAPADQEGSDYGQSTTYAGQRADQPSGYPPAPPPPPPPASSS